MSEFQPGFASRHAAAASALSAAFALPRGFEAIDLKAPAAPRAFAPQDAGGPRHFAPHDPDSNPTEGWDPLDPSTSQPEHDAFVDPVAAAHAAGYAEGMAAALARDAVDSGRDRAFVEALGEALGRGRGFDRERLALQLRQTVLLLVGRLVGEVGVSGELLAGRIESAVDCLADAAESALLRVHPDDVALLEGRLPRTLFAVGDAAVARGSFVLESASTIVEDGPDQWLEQLSQAIERAAVPSC